MSSNPLHLSLMRLQLHFRLQINTHPETIKNVPPVQLNYLRGSKLARKATVTLSIPTFIQNPLVSQMLRRSTNICHSSPSVKLAQACHWSFSETAGRNCLIAIKVKAAGQCVQQKLASHSFITVQCPFVLVDRNAGTSWF